MEEVHFIKCETGCTPDTEELSKFEQDVQLPCVNSLEAKVEPYHKSDDQGDDDISDSLNEELIIQDVKQEPSDDDLDSGTFPNEKQSLLYIAITEGKEANSCESTKECTINSKEHKDSAELGEIQYLKLKKTFRCDRCEKIFRGSFALARHALIHTGERPFVCDTCSKTFQQKAKLKAHLMVHTKERPHLCTTCGKAFTRKDALRIHIMRHKGDKSHQCPMCGRAFINTYLLRTHLMRHKGEKPHLCPSCREAFVNPYVLKIHMTTHSRNKVCI